MTGAFNVQSVLIGIRGGLNCFELFDSGSNIVFSNGLLDPWRGGGVQTSISDTLTAILIPEVCLLVSVSVDCVGVLESLINATLISSIPWQVALEQAELPCLDISSSMLPC
jgi:hypothetical protein